MTRKNHNECDSCSSSSETTGNTSPSRATRARRSRRWCFTWNGTYDTDVLIICMGDSPKWIAGHEVAPTTGTKHLQGYVEFPNARRLSNLKKSFPTEIHWEIAKGDRMSNIKYCSKEGFAFGPLAPKKSDIKVLQWEQLYAWQREIVDICRSPPDDRKVYWFWEPNGNVGKTSLIKYILVNLPNACFSRATKSADILTSASEDKNVYLFDFARSQEGFAPWIAIEQLKDGLISDCKLKKEARNIIMNPPTVICFANWSPDTSALSADRWVIHKIE